MLRTFSDGFMNEISDMSPIFRFYFGFLGALGLYTMFLAFRKMLKREHPEVLPEDKKKFPVLESLLSCELGQDTDLFGDTQPHAIANWARMATQEEKDALLRELEGVTQGSHDEFNDASSELFGFEKTCPVFDMIRAIVTDPNCYKQYDD